MGSYTCVKRKFNMNFTSASLFLVFTSSPHTHQNTHFYMSTYDARTFYERDNNNVSSATDLLSKVIRHLNAIIMLRDRLTM